MPELWYGDVIATSGGYSGFWHVFHASAPWRDGCSNVPFCIEGLTMRCLKFCDDLHLTSIAIPPLGTGIAGCPVDEVARGFFQGFVTYLKNNPQSGITKIGIVVYN